MMSTRAVWKRLPVPLGVRVARRAAGQYLWRARRAGAAWQQRRAEDDEVHRLGTRVGSLPHARVVTVIATYQRPHGLVEAVQSALAQQVDDHLVVVVDDGGGGLPELPDDDRLVVLALARNHGCLGMVRNVAIRLTRSDVLAFLDDDNVWSPDHLVTTLAEIDRGADVVYTDLHRVRPDGTTFDVLSEPFDRRRLWLHSYVDSNALVLRRTPAVVFSRIPRQKEDWALVLRLSRRSRVVHVPRTTVRYLVNPASYYSQWARAGAEA
jgi:glycosyltransferase involved in cell wall biosynthesis